MSKGNIFENEILYLVFHGEPIAGLADVGVADPLVALYMSLHTSILTETSSQDLNEAAYSGYARVALPRDALTWDITDGIVSNIDPIEFPIAAADGLPITYAAVGTEASGSGKILYYGPVVTPLTILTGIIPRIEIGELRIGEE